MQQTISQWIGLLKYWCNHTFFWCPFVIALFLYFLPGHTRFTTWKNPQKSQCFQIIRLIKNKKTILVKFQCLPILSHWLIHKTVMKYQPHATKQILPSNTDTQLWYNTIRKSWHMKVISEIRKALWKKKRGGQKEEKSKKSFYWEIRMWVHRSGTRHLGCLLGTWKEKYKNTWKKVERRIWKDIGKNLKGYTENLESAG